MGISLTKQHCEEEICIIAAASMALKDLAENNRYADIANQEEIAKAENLFRDLQRVFMAMPDGYSLLEKAVRLKDDFKNKYLVGGGLDENEDIGGFTEHPCKFTEKGVYPWGGTQPHVDFKNFGDWLTKNFKWNYMKLEGAVGRYTHFGELPGVYISA